MAFIRYQSPDDSAFIVFETSRFRVDHAIFLLYLDPLRERIKETLEERQHWNLQAMKLVEENRRLVACLDWLDTIPHDSDSVHIPELKHEPALDVVADGLIGEGQYERMYCPACEIEYRAERITREPWEFKEEGVTVLGHRSTCPQGHTIHVRTEGIDALDLESPDD
jgi:hypothetical protein